MQDRRGKLAALRILRRLRFAACGLCGLSAGLLADSSALQVGLASWWQEPAPRARSISVSGHTRLATQDVALAAGVTKGSLLTDIDARAVERRLASHPWIRSARAAVLPSGELLVSIDERKPRAVVRSDSEAQGWLVDDSGFPFSPAEPELAAGLPSLRGNPTLFGDGQQDLLVRALAIVDAVREGPLREVSPTTGARDRKDAASWPEGLELQLPAPHSHQGWILRSAHPRVDVILGAAGVEPRLERLAQLLGSDCKEVSGAESIDLRFADRAVLRAASVSR